MLAVAFALLALLQPPTADGGSARPAARGERLKVLVMDLSAEGGVDQGTVNTLTGIVSAELSTYRDLDVMANADVRRMLELEGEKQAVGCGDASCLAEIAGAMGAQLVVFGSVGKLGDELVVHLNLYDSQKAQSVGRQFLEADNVARVPSLLRPKLRLLLERTYADLGLALPPPPVEAPAPTVVVAPVPRDPGVLPWVLIGGGAVGVVGGAAAAYFGSSPWFIYQDQLAQHEDARTAGDVELGAALRDNSGQQAESWNSWGMATTVVGGVLVVGGVVAAGVGGALLAFPGVE